MKKFSLIIPITIALSILFYPTTSTSNATGSPGGKTGSPMDGQNCTGCHSGSINSGSGNVIISTNIPTTGYIIGNTYTITLTGNKSGCLKFGFELTSESGNNKSGDLMITDNTTKLLSSNNSVTHKNSGTNGSSTKIWTMNWIPNNNSNINTTFYASIIFANANSNFNGDNVFTTSLTVNEAIVNAISNLSETNKFKFNSATKIIESNTTILVYDINGKEVLITQGNTTNISHLNPGVYILKSAQKNQKIVLY